MSATRTLAILLFMVARFVSPAEAQYMPSPHELDRWVAGVGDARECEVCHVLATGQPSDPAWMTSLPAAARYRVYGEDRRSRTLDAIVGPPDGSSLMCLSCHDGTAASDIGHSPRPVGSDLSDDHPISFVYDSDLAARDGFLADPSTEVIALQALDGRLLSGTIEQLLLEGGKVQCVSCHDAHDRFGQRSLLKVTDERSVLCEVCHRK